MDNICFIAWTFDDIFGGISSKFQSLEDLNAWKEKYNVKVNAIHRYKNKHFDDIIFEDEIGKRERLKAEARQEAKRQEEERKKRLSQHLYIDFVNGHRYI